MSCYTAEQRAFDEEYLASLKEQLTALKKTMISASSSTTESYRLDDGTGSQQKKYRSMKDLRFDLQNLKKEIDYYERKLNGCLNINIRQRRRLYRHREPWGY